MESLERQFAGQISMADTGVFPQQPCKILVVNEPPSAGKPQFAFAYDTVNQDNSFYVVYSGLLGYFEAGKPFATHAMLEPDALFRAQQKGVLAFTNPEIFLGAAIHEVRHRVQCCLKVPLFNQTHTDQVLRCRFWGQVQGKHYKSVPDGDREFDAKFFECYAAHEYRQGRLKINEQDLGNLLRMTVEQFLERESKL